MMYMQLGMYMASQNGPLELHVAGHPTGVFEVVSMEKILPSVGKQQDSSHSNMKCTLTLQPNLHMLCH